MAEETGVLFPVEGGYVAFFLDIDNDGQLDVFVSTMSAFPDVLNSLVTGEAIEPNRPFLYHNMGDGTFTDIALPAGLARSFGTMGAGVGDVDNDGFVDIYLANGGPQMSRLEPNVLYRTAAAVDSLQVHWPGGVSQRFSDLPINCLIRVTEGDARYQAAQAGGGLMDVGCYCVNLTRAVMGSEPSDTACFAHLHELGVDDYAAGVLRFGDKTLATFT